MLSPVITLTTDFGSEGWYVASMKGVILGINPRATIVDVNHSISPQNVREAALCIAQIASYFPAGTIHVVVVDPGVGTERRLLCVPMRDQVFLAPDNGVLSWAARGVSVITRVALSEPRFWLPTISSTFHGRDVVAPVAAHLSLGVPVHELGTPVAQWQELPWPEPAVQSGQLGGEVLAIDHFGNLITNIEESTVARLCDRRPIIVRYRDRDVPLARTYSDVPVAHCVALIGSTGLLEIAQRNGSAADQLHGSVGDAVQLLVPRNQASNTARS